MDCEYIKECNFFNSAELRKNPTLVGALREVFCEGNPSLCARRKVALAIGYDQVPPQLKPNQNQQALDLIASLQNN